MKIKEDLTGKIFGKLTILSRDSSKIGQSRGSFWICQCECGEIRSISRQSLVIHGTKSCGCLQKSESFALDGNRAVKNSWIRKYVSRAKRDGVEFSLTEDEFFLLCSQDCEYCGDAPVERNTYLYKRKFHDNIPLIANGIDRVDPNKGYSTENSVPCCTPCNLMKTDKTQQDFINRAIRIAKRHNKNGT